MIFTILNLNLLCFFFPDTARFRLHGLFHRRQASRQISHRGELFETNLICPLRPKRIDQ